jgi:hypothetical protein
MKVTAAFDSTAPAADEEGMTATTLLEPGRTVLVAAAPDDEAWQMIVGGVHNGEVTLTAVENEQLPSAWSALTETHITTVDRFSVHLIHVPVLRVDAATMVVAEPNSATPVQRRAFARVREPVPATCMLLDTAENQWIPFDAEVRDLGGGGLSLVADVIAPESATVAMSLMLGGPPLVAVGRVLPRDALPTIGRPLLRVEFLLIRETDRDRIMGFVLKTLAFRYRDNDDDDDDD